MAPLRALAGAAQCAFHLSSAARVAIGVTALLAPMPMAYSQDVAPAVPAAPAGTNFAWGAELSGALAAEDRGFFNDADYGRSYGRNLLRLGVVSLQGAVRIGTRVALVGELRSENLDAPRVFAAYLRWRVLESLPLDLQVGRIPPVFGSYARRRYAADNPLVGTPLAYQYLTSLRSDAVPVTADGFRRTRGAGWRPFYPVGSREQGTGLPLVNPLRWDAGVELRLGTEPVALAVALTQGSLSNPRVRDDNEGKQIAARLAWHPVVGLVLGASVARGEYVEDELLPALPEPARERGYRQTAWGADLEYSAGYWLLRAEAVVSRWEVPPVRPPDAGKVRATALFAEARRTLLPGFYLAARAERLGFGRIEGAAASFTWDANVTRLEAGLGWAPWRHVLLKGAYQHNRRDGGFVKQQSFVAGQVVLWY